ncbi:MAG: DoxX family protein [Candidatus Pacebacteria bacterium]|nr:DoxX family protein [Candidatus Paceibacterota bacterium]MBP9840327.1 DoxX family protein [Candidatus Paceibacterota bacterium]
MSRFHGVELFLIRIVVGAIFVAHGYEKYVGGVAGVANMLTKYNFPAPDMFAVILIAAELIGGTLLILGALTHWVSKVLTIVAAVALVVVHLPNGFTGQGGYEFILLILVCCIALMIAGPGKWSVDAMMKKNG